MGRPRARRRGAGGAEVLAEHLAAHVVALDDPDQLGRHALDAIVEPADEGSANHRLTRATIVDHFEARLHEIVGTEDWSAVQDIVAALDRVRVDRQVEALLVGQMDALFHVVRKAPMLG